MPQKFAKSKDSVQQALRDRKKGFNLAAREFIKRLIGFKQGINGRGNPGLGLPPGDIKEPIPSEVQSFAAEVEANFAQLMGAAKQIEAEQAAYSERKQRQIVEREQRKTQPKEEPKPALPEIAKPASMQVIIKKASRNEMATGKLIVKDHEIDNVLLARTPSEQEIGLMYRPSPAPTMAFIYDRPQYDVAFWMKNTIAPLDIVFALNGKVMAIRNGEPYSTATIRCPTPADLVIEFDQGTCQKLGIREGDRVRLEP